MNDPSTCRHPLDVARADGAAVAHAVAVLHGAGKHIGDRLDAAMRVPWETRQVIGGNLVTEIVKEEERIEIGSVAETERTPQAHTCAFSGRLGLEDSLHRTDGHDSLQCRGRVNLGPCIE